MRVFCQEVIMKTLNIVTSLALSFAVGTAVADVELSSLVQWEETQNGQVVTKVSVSNADFVKNINEMEATAAGGEQISSLVQWEESQYATPYLLKDQSDHNIVSKINTMEATAAGKNQMSSLIQWEEAF
jgi:hypothetical protein